MHASVSRWREQLHRDDLRDRDDRADWRGLVHGFWPERWEQLHHDHLWQYRHH